jgi:2-succinyl-5-enolpyruvyl-6-hydroxy-3-cyclohexene-1-carboxylate synthase
VSGPANLGALWARALVQELIAGGVREAVVCPGSRSTPLALACFALRDQGLQVRSVIDERSAAFVALGAAKATGRPALVLATSGSAGAHFYPALLEAEAFHLPLIALTADRPSELHGWGAPQTMDQQDLFGRHVRFFADLGVPEGTEAALLHLRATVSLALARATQGQRGPVHLNAPFREPLAPEPGPLPEGLSARALAGPAARLLAPACTPEPASLDLVAAELRRRPRGVIVCGPRDGVREGNDGGPDDLAAAAQVLSRALGYPVLAESTSNLRGAGREVVTTADTLLRHAPFARAAAPQAVVRLGGGLSSKVTQQWLDASGAFTVQLAGAGPLHDPAHAASLIVQGDAALACSGLAARLLAGVEPGPLSKLFAVAEEKAQAALVQAFARTPGLTEPLVARTVAAALPEGALLLVGSSMPVRDLDAFAPPSLRARVLSSRGLNGIDGTLSTALGAAASTGRPVCALVGDVTLLHDVGAFVTAKRLGVPLTVVCVNNDGGGIFSFLPVAGAVPPADFEALFGTPHGVDLAAVAALGGARLRRPDSPERLAEALAGALGKGLHLIEVTTRREENVAAHRALQQAVYDALGGGPWV